MAGRHLIPGATELTPLKQGTLSRLCGLYSVLNAIQLAIFPQRLKKAELQVLYAVGVAHLAKRRQLRAVLGVGMHEEVWLRLAADLLVYTNDQYGSSLRLDRPGKHRCGVRRLVRTTCMKGF